VTGELPNVPRLLMELGYLGIRKGRVAEAQVLLKGAQALRPADPTPAMFLGMAHFASGRYSEAERTYRQILEKHDDDLTRSFLGESLIAQKRWAEAEEALQAVVERNREPTAVTFASELLTQLKRGLFQRAE
jgi:Flp pilus assembly protein TadD